MQKYTYTSDFYESVNQRASETAKLVFEILKKYVRADSILDVGCGSGAWIHTALEEGLEKAYGLDLKSSIGHINKNSDFKEYLDSGRIKLIERDFVSDPISEFPKADLALCLEVLEHLPPSIANSLVFRLTEASNFVIFSAAQPGQGGTYHINEQELIYWVDQFAKYNFEPFDPFREILSQSKFVPRFYSLNMLLMVSKEALDSGDRFRDRASLINSKLTDFKQLDKKTFLEKVRYKIITKLPVSTVTWLSKKFKY
jgi:SAM-dependent methyltransferase